MSIRQYINLPTYPFQYIKMKVVQNVIRMSYSQYVIMSICQNATFQFRYQNENCSECYHDVRQSENFYGQLKSPILLSYKLVLRCWSRQFSFKSFSTLALFLGLRKSVKWNCAESILTDFGKLRSKHLYSEKEESCTL